MKANTLIIALIAITFSIQAQSLEELVNMAITQNKEIEILDKQYQVALQKAPQVSQLPDTEIGVGGFPLPVETRLGPQFIRLSAAQMFPWFGTFASKEDLENTKAMAIREKATAKALHIEYEVKQNYYQLYELQKRQSIIQQNKTLLESLDRLAQAKVSTGKASASDVLRIQLQKEKLLQTLDQLKSQETIPTIKINELAERSLDQTVNINTDFEFAVLNFPEDSILANISQFHPMIRMFAIQQDISKKHIEVNKLNGKPSFGVGMDYIMVGKRTDAQPARNGRDILQVRAMVKFPIQQKKYKAKDAEERLKIEGWELEKENLLHAFKARIAQGSARYETARIEKANLEKQIPLIKSTIKMLQGDYAAKGRNFDELLRLEMELIEYEVNILKTIMESHRAKTDMERFMIQ